MFSFNLIPVLDKIFVLKNPGVWWLVRSLGDLALCVHIEQLKFHIRISCILYKGINCILTGDLLCFQLLFYYKFD